MWVDVRLGLGTKGSGWEVDGNKKIFWVVDGNKRNLMELFGNKEDFDGNKLRNLMGVVWELDGNNGNLMGIQPPTFSKREKQSLGGMLATPNWLSSHVLS